MSNLKSEFLLTNAEDFIGQEMALTDWVHLDQAQTNLFGEVTRWPTWMHCDAKRAQRESPYGGTILHGFHMLSLLTHFLEVAGLRPGDGAYSLNYGLDKMRVLQPVLIGDGVKIRDRMSLSDVVDKGQGQKIIKTGNKLEVQGMEGPVLYAEYLSYWYPNKKTADTN